RRYETANGFAMDVQRYLADEPVIACPPSVGYRFRKFARRHKVGFAMASLVLTALVLTAVILALSTFRIHNEKLQKDAALQQAKENEERTLANLRLALKALDGIYLQVVEDRLPRDPVREKEDKQLLRKALEFYQQFARSNSGSAMVRLEVS